MKLMVVNGARVTLLEDQRLLDLIAADRDRSALAELYERYRCSLGGFLRRWLYEDKLADEVYNDVMMAVWQKAEGFRGDSKVSTWIFGIAYRTCMSHTRKEQKHTANAADYEFNNIAQEQETDLVGELRDAMTELSDDHRNVVELAYFYGHSLVEISEMIDCPVNTVKTRLYHARLKLKVVIENQQNAPLVDLINDTLGG